METIIMAMGNWAKIAFGPDGKPCDGTLRSSDGKRAVETYKNWLYVHDAIGWNKSLRYENPVVAEIRSGDMVVAGFEICAARLEARDGLVAVIVEPDNAPGNTSGKPHSMLAIACSGYDENGQWVGVSGDVLAEATGWFRGDDEPYCDEEWFRTVVDGLSHATAGIDQGQEYVAKMLLAKAEADAKGKPFSWESYPGVL